MSMELPRIDQERNAYRNLILSSEHGKGLVHPGNYYHLCYEPYTPNAATLKCEGVTLTILRNLDNSNGDFFPAIVPFKDKELGFFDSLNGKVKRPFNIRFKEECDRMIAIINEFDDHNRKVEETAKKVVQCKMNIDDLVSEITGGQSVSYVKMMDENSQKALPAGTFIKNPKDNLFGFNTPEPQETPVPKVTPSFIFDDAGTSKPLEKPLTGHDEHAWQGKRMYQHNPTQRFSDDPDIKKEFPIDIQDEHTRQGKGMYQTNPNRKWTDAEVILKADYKIRSPNIFRD